MRAVVLAALIALSTCAHPVFAQSCQRFDDSDIVLMQKANIEVDVLSGYQMAAFLALLAEHVPIEVKPTRVVVVFADPMVRIGFLVDDGMCQVVRGPSKGTREMIKAARGHGV